MIYIEAQPTHPSVPTYHPQILPQPASIIIKHKTFDGMIKQDNINHAIKKTTTLLFQDSRHNILPYQSPRTQQRSELQRHKSYMQKKQ